MKAIRYSEHALANLTDRDISREEVDRTLTEADAVAPGHGGRKVYMRQYHDAVLDQEMLLRVIVEETEMEIVVVTAYKTSRAERYLKGSQP
jgi:hypothetical protein